MWAGLTHWGQRSLNSNCERFLFFVYHVVGVVCLVANNWLSHGCGMSSPVDGSALGSVSELAH